MARMRTQPQGAAIVDWSNPITQGLVFAFSHGAAGASGWCLNGSTQNPYTAATPISSPIGYVARCNTAGSKAYILGGNHGLTSTNYSLFAFGTASSLGTTQMAIDMDNAGPRYFQFRLNAGKVEFIPFNTSAAVTGQPTMLTALSTTELNRGFTMGATASPTRIAAFQNNQIATAVPTSLIAPTTTLPISIGARSTSTTGWTIGGIGLVAGWNRTLSDAEMLSLAANPWQMFLGWSDEDVDYFSIAPSTGLSYSYTPSGGINFFGEGTLSRIRNAVSSGVLTLSGQATRVTNIARSVVGSGGLFLAGVGGRVAEAITSATGGMGFSGLASVISQIAGQTTEEVFGALNDIISQKLRALGKIGALRDMLDENKYWRALAGNSNKPINDVKKEYLKSQGLTGHVNEMEKQYWKNK